MVSNIFYFHPYLGKWSILTNIFQMGWNHQLDWFGCYEMGFTCSKETLKLCWVHWIHYPLALREDVQFRYFFRLIGRGNTPRGILFSSRCYSRQISSCMFLYTVELPPPCQHDQRLDPLEEPLKSEDSIMTLDVRKSTTFLYIDHCLFLARCRSKFISLIYSQQSTGISAKILQVALDSWKCDIQ